MRRRAEKSAKELPSFGVFSQLPLKSHCNCDQNGPDKPFSLIKHIHLIHGNNLVMFLRINEC